MDLNVAVWHDISVAVSQLSYTDYIIEHNSGSDVFMYRDESYF